MSAPRIDVLLAVRNESALIAAKLANLAALRGAEALRIFVIDGGSSDDTIEKAEAAARQLGLCVEILSAPAGKIPQLNRGLERVTAPWVLVTDADARMSPSALDEMRSAVNGASDVMLVGAPARVDSSYPLEQVHWLLSNRFRTFEHGRGSAGLVLGPCYLMRRDLLERFPDDVLSDDIYASCRAAEAGGRIALSPTPVMELRAAEGPIAFCLHKHRKALGYLREVRRFLPRVHRMRGPAAAAFRVRTALLAALPFVAVLAVALGVLLSSSAPLVAGVIGAVIVAPLAGAPLPERIRAVGVVAWLPLIAVIIVTAVIVGPFLTATSAYPASRLRRGARAA